MTPTQKLVVDTLLNANLVVDNHVQNSECNDPDLGTTVILELTTGQELSVDKYGIMGNVETY